MYSIRVSSFFAFGIIAFVAGQKPPAEVRYQWKYLNFTWPSNDAHDKAIVNGEYVPKHNAIAGIKVWKDYMFLTLPRWRRGVPATMVVTSLEPNDGDKSPNLQPYPNWQKQRIGDCSAFQFVQSMEIDPQGRMWILDTGRIATLEDNTSLCPPRLIILDIEDNGRVLLNYEFPNDVIDPKTVYLNDIVLDHEDGGYAYISNADDEKPSLIVFSLEQRKSWQVTHESMYATASKFTINTDHVKMTKPVNIDSIALSAASNKGHRLVYYAPLSSRELFTIPTSVLKHHPQDFASRVKLLGKKPSQTDGMMISADDTLHFGLLGLNSVSKWDTNKSPFAKFQKREFEDDDDLMWPDTFAIDENGDVWVTSNKLERMFADKFDVDEVNFGVVKLEELKYKSYQYYEDGSTPKMPVIED